MGIAERKERERARRQRDILDAAITLFAGDDWRAVTIEQIAERAEIGKGTIYKHFASKDEIYATLTAEFRAQSLQRLESIDETQPVIQRLRKVIEVFWEQHQGATEYQHLVQYCEREDFRRSLPAAMQDELDAQDARLQAAIDRVLQAGVAEGILPRKPLKALVFGPMATLQGAVRMLWSGALEAETRPRQYLDEVTNFILAGMLYQEWLAGEGLDAGEARRRAEAELAAAADDVGS